jgi:Mg2+-importing ATPase
LAEGRHNPKVEITKKVFYADPMHLAGTSECTRGREHRIHGRAVRFSHGDCKPRHF